MNENAKMWVEALRSGKYKQARGALRKDEGYCCLGVACDLYRQAVEGSWTQITRDAADEWVFRSQGASLPVAVRDWLGIRATMGAFHNGSRRTSLAAMNDDDATFALIADVIESEPEGLFA